MPFAGLATLESLTLKSNFARSLVLDGQVSRKWLDLIPLERAESKLLFSEIGEMAGLVVALCITPTWMVVQLCICRLVGGNTVYLPNLTGGDTVYLPPPCWW